MVYTVDMDSSVSDSYTAISVTALLAGATSTQVEALMYELGVALTIYSDL